MGDLAYETSDSPPPPAYEISQHEFDQKTTRILAQSAEEPPEPRVDEDGFEVWDEALFEAALASMNTLSVTSVGSDSKKAAIPVPPTATGYPSEKARAEPIPPSPPLLPQERVSPRASGSGTAGSSSQTRPLRVTRKPRAEKERPSWYAEAGLDANPPPPQVLSPPVELASSPLQGHDQPRLSRAPRRQLTVANNNGDVAELTREMTPPPEFTPVGPSLDGPPYETIVMTYDGPELEPAESLPDPPAFDTLPEAHTPHPPTPPPPLEPLRADDVRAHPAHSQSLPPNPTESSSPPIHPHVHHSQSVPTIAAPPLQPSQAAYPLRNYQQSAKYPSAARLAFDPRMAYGKPLPTVPQEDEPQPEMFGVSSFYSHAVAAHFSSNVPTRPRAQSNRGSMYNQQWPAPAPPSNFYEGAADKVSPPVVSPRPSYAYGQATFSDATQGAGNQWNHGGQQAWPSAGGGGSQHWR